MFRLFVSVVAAISLLCSTQVSAGTIFQDAYFLNLDTVKLVECTEPNGFGRGTGFVIGKNRIVTANHVVKGALSCSVGGKPATLVSFDPAADMAVIEVDLGTKPPVLEINCDGFVAGNTYFSLGFAKAQDFAMTKMVATGRFEDFEPDDPTDKINAHMAILSGLVISGMSGGPIIDMDGRVVGINNATDLGKIGLSRALADTKLCEGLKKPAPAPFYPVQPQVKIMTLDELMKLFPPPSKK